MIKMIGLVVVMIIVYSAGAFACYEVGKYIDNRITDETGNFEDCVSEGYSVIQVYPRICVDSNGNTYTEKIEQFIN